jgi:hypothetical protein
LGQRINIFLSCRGEVKNGVIEPVELIKSNSPRFEAGRLYREGYSVKAIAQVLGRPVERIGHWCWRVQALSNTINAYEWREVFRLRAAKIMESESDKNSKTNEIEGVVHLVCVRTSVKNNAHQLAEVVSESLKANPCNGEKYAFCSKKNTILTIIQFDGKTFVSTTRRRLGGQYVWPDEKFGGMIDVTEAEFSLIYNEVIHRVPSGIEYKNCYAYL